MPYTKFEVTITAIIFREDGRMLITKRSATKRLYPSRWTVPGGHLEVSDYNTLPKTPGTDWWYEALEIALSREVLEEVGLTVQNVKYLTSMATNLKDSDILVISCYADVASGEVVLQQEEAVEAAWVTAEEARDFDLIEGIRAELELAEQKWNHERWNL